MEPYLIVHNTSRGLTCAYAATLSAAKRLAANWLAVESSHYPTRSIAIVYLPEDRLLYFQEPNHPVGKLTGAVRWLSQAIGETWRMQRDDAFGRLVQLFRPATR